MRSTARLALALLSLLVPGAGMGEVVRIPDSGGIEVDVRHPPGFDEEDRYSVLVSPGDFYWPDSASQPGWVVVVSDAFYGPGRLERSRKVLDWLRVTYPPRHGGFHIAGWSANSAGVFEIALTFPEEFLSVTGIAGMPGPGSEERLERLRGIRVQLVVGELDSYWRSGSERWHEMLVEMGIRSTLEIVPHGGHAMPELVNEPIFERLDALVRSLGDPR